MGIFDEIKLGIKQAIEFEKGKKGAKVTVLSILPTETFSPSEIKEIRKKTGLTQVLFAKYMGVSVKTVESWEAGRNHPEGSACRLLTLTRNNPDFPKLSGIINA